MSCLSLRTFFFIADPQSVHLKKFSLLPEYRRYYKKFSLIRNKDKNNVMISLLISLCHEMVLTYIDIHNSETDYSLSLSGSNFEHFYK